MHSRGFVLSENQAFAGQTRTPGPSRLQSSPTRKAMTTGKRGLAGQSSKLFGQEPGSAGPKQLFQDIMSSKSPVKALGDRNAAKTPGPSRHGPSKQDASLRKSKGAAGGTSEASPGKKGTTEPSPQKASTSNALRSLNGKQRQTTDLPFTKPTQSSSNDGAASMLKTPAPTQLGSKARTMSRQNSFVTPAANVGRAGQIKARMGEILDAEMGRSLQKGDNANEQVAAPPVVQLSEEEMYPEIEYMPPSHHAKHPVFEFPDELDDLPRAKELGTRLSVFSAIGFHTATPDDLSDVEVGRMETVDEDDLDLALPVGESDEDDPWPDVAAPMQASALGNGAISAAVERPVVATGSVAATGVQRSVGEGVKQRVVTVSSKALTANASVGRRLVPAKPSAQPATRPNGLQRSIASAPGSRATSSASTVPRSTMATRPTSSIRQSMASARSVPREGGVARAPSLPAERKATATRLNPKLIDFVNDDLGKQTQATLERLDAEDNVEALRLELEEPAQDEA